MVTYFRLSYFIPLLYKYQTQTQCLLTVTWKTGHSSKDGQTARKITTDRLILMVTSLRLRYIFPSSIFPKTRTNVTPFDTFFHLIYLKYIAAVQSSSLVRIWNLKFMKLTTCGTAPRVEFKNWARPRKTLNRYRVWQVCLTSSKHLCILTSAGRGPFGFFEVCESVLSEGWIRPILQCFLISYRRFCLHLISYEHSQRTETNGVEKHYRNFLVFLFVALIVWN
jgi:hypothetical protein